MQYRSLSAKHKNRLILVLALTSIYFLVELVGGFLTNSLALLADAGHMLSDVASLGLALLAIWFASRPPTPEKTYGYWRAEILAALINGVTLVLIAIYIIWEAWQRFGRPPEVNSLPMFLVATVGLGVNLLSAAILYPAQRGSLNLRGAFLHTVSDVLGSLGAMAAGLIMLTTGQFLADPMISVFIALLILYGAWRLLRESVDILLEGAPARIDLQEVSETMREVRGVGGVHDLHIWTLTSGVEAMSCHIELANKTNAHDAQRIIERLRTLLKDRYGIEHATLQIEEKSLEEEEMPF